MTLDSKKEGAPVKKPANAVKRATLFVCFAAFLTLLLSQAGSTAEEIDAAALFKRRCTTCHGSDGVPKAFAKGAPNFSDKTWKNSVTTEELTKIITQGKGRMTAFEGRLTAEEIKAIAEYVRTL